MMVVRDAFGFTRTVSRAPAGWSEILGNVANFYHLSLISGGCRKGAWLGGRRRVRFRASRGGLGRGRFCWWSLMWEFASCSQGPGVVSVQARSPEELEVMARRVGPRRLAGRGATRLWLG
jgi:hypothetical protein